MAKRKRLTPSAAGPQNDPETAQTLPSGPLETKAFLRPNLSAAGAPPIARVAADASTAAALAEVSGEMSRARAEGRLVQALPLDVIDADHLVRDRIATDEEGMAQLMASLAEHGQRMPIEVADLGQGRYGLISGWRRYQALTRLSAQEGPAQFGTVLALLRRPDAASDAYIAMVEENEVRLGLSYYERARIVARAVDLGVFASEKQALQRLFSNASRARRSKIGSFIALYRQFDAVLRFPAAIPERLGLALAKDLDAAPDPWPARLAELSADPAMTGAEETARLAAYLSQKGSVPAPKTAAPSRTEPCSGVYLDVTGGFLKPVLTISGPSVGPDLREALEEWLAKRS